MRVEPGDEDPFERIDAEMQEEFQTIRGILLGVLGGLVIWVAVIWTIVGLYWYFTG